MWQPENVRRRDAIPHSQQGVSAPAHPPQTSGQLPEMAGQCGFLRDLAAGVCAQVYPRAVLSGGLDRGPTMRGTHARSIAESNGENPENNLKFS